MKKISLVFVFLSIFTTISAQTSATDPKVEKNHSMALDFSAGYSLSLGSYRAFDQDNKKSGYAANGFLVQAGFTRMGKKNFGLAIQYTYQKNALNDTASHVVPDGMKSMLGPGSWSNHYLMLGPVFMKMIKKKLYIDAKVLGGDVVSLSPNLNTPDPSDTSRVKFNKNTGTGFAFQVSAGIGYTISAHLAFNFNLSLLGAWPVARKQHPAQLIGSEKIYDPVTGLYYDKPVYSAPVEYEIKKTISTLSPAIGLVYRF